ncbi:hypothetical protein BFP72_00555 [Reichenbachiella sp. 5M10]|uniref:heme NO-binding domain-containing protein n=1 Tax=Reichenbachiella sp. 5M10 TaxID=1889772 RepID=UPI000C1622A3|nr:heme NO-binding domain-containing protein [Reichenbachiella sp. 5M10]PIB34024.1 hypothetical protein BFP72_00555 [Reichenbachiella sp. 5M10]
MKGIVFTEFLVMVESKFGLEAVDHIIQCSELPNGGAYTSIGTYDFGEMQRLIEHLSLYTELSKDDLIYAFGMHFFQYLKGNYPYLFKMYETPVAFISSVEDHIHVQVRKIYPQAQLPSFEVIEHSDTKLTLVYRSPKGFYKFAEALIRQTFCHYNETCEVSYKLMKEDGTQVKFNVFHHGDRPN